MGPGPAGARASEGGRGRGRGRGPFGCSLGSDLSSATSPALGIALLGVEIRFLGRPPPTQFPCGRRAERQGGEPGLWAPARPPPQEERGGGKGLMSALQETPESTQGRAGASAPQSEAVPAPGPGEAQAELSPAGLGLCLVWGHRAARHLCRAWPWVGLGVVRGALLASPQAPRSAVEAGAALEAPAGVLRAWVAGEGVGLVPTGAGAALTWVLGCWGGAGQRPGRAALSWGTRGPVARVVQRVWERQLGSTG